LAIFRHGSTNAVHLHGFLAISKLVFVQLQGSRGFFFLPPSFLAEDGSCLPAMRRDSTRCVQNAGDSPQSPFPSVSLSFLYIRPSPSVSWFSRCVFTSQNWCPGLPRRTPLCPPLSAVITTVPLGLRHKSSQPWYQASVGSNNLLLVLGWLVYLFAIHKANTLPPPYI